MARREFLQLAKTYQPDKPKPEIAGWYISEKLDGSRCLWDGGISRGVPTKDVPYASVINPRTGEPKTKVKPVATGLWSRYGNPIMAPEWFLDNLPECPLDGELWAGRGNFQLCRSICAGDTPDPRFKQIKFMVYSSPPIGQLFGPGEIKNPNFHCTFGPETLVWAESQMSVGYKSLPGGSLFAGEYHYYRDLLANHTFVHAHEQIELPQREDDARQAVETFLNGVLDLGGEGVIIRDPDAIWTPKRVNALLKYKPFEDAEGVVTGFTCGRLTELGSKHLGRIGALILDFNGKRLELSGLTDAEREFAAEEDRHYANEHPGEDMPSDTQGKHFKVGDTVTFKYRELSDDGIPKEARYMRQRGVE